MKKFWNWIHDDSGGRVLRLEGPIDNENFWGDEITPAMFREDLEAEAGDVTVWINSPGGNVFAAAEIYTMLKEYGYDNKDGELVINEEEAEWVRWIFAQALSGKTSGWIARELNDRNLTTKKKATWRAGTIRGITEAASQVGQSRTHASVKRMLQNPHYTDYIGKHPGWELAGIYADDGISGTNTKKREEFNRLIDDCMAGRVDMVVTKSISRFARNTLDCLKYIRQLKDKNIAVFFEKEAINTLDAKGEVLLTIMASLAQQESQSLSQNVRLGLQYRYQQGKVQVCTNRFLGYDKDEDGNLVINPEEAEVVKRIYREYLGGKSYYQIGQELSADGFRTAAGNDYWLPSTLKKILTNEKYIGDALLQKTITTDFLNKKRVVNKGIVPQYYVEGSHEAIIPRELFMQVQEEMVRRANLETGTGKRRTYSGKYALSHHVYCAHCGDVFRRTVWFLKGKNVPVWRCVSRLERKKSGIDCPARTLFETDLHAAVVKALNQMIEQKDEFLPGMRLAVDRALAQSNSPRVREIDAQLAELQKDLLKKANAKQGYEDLAEEIETLRSEKEGLLLEDANRIGLQKRLDELETFLDEHQEPVTDYDEGLVRRLVDRITVYDDCLAFEFKSGLETEVQI